MTASFPSDSRAPWGSTGAGGCCHTRKAPLQPELELEATATGQESPQNFRASTSVEKLASRFSELLCCLLLTVIYGTNNNSLTDVEGPGEESGCGRGGTVSLLGKKFKKKKIKKKVNYFPK